MEWKTSYLVPQHSWNSRFHFQFFFICYAIWNFPNAIFITQKVCGRNFLSKYLWNSKVNYKFLKWPCLMNEAVSWFFSENLWIFRHQKMVFCSTLTSWKWDFCLSRSNMSTFKIIIFWNKGLKKFLKGTLKGKTFAPSMWKWGRKKLL